MTQHINYHVWHTETRMQWHIIFHRVRHTAYPVELSPWKLDRSEKPILRWMEQWHDNILGPTL